MMIAAIMMMKKMNQSMNNNPIKKVKNLLRKISKKNKSKSKNQNSVKSFLTKQWQWQIRRKMKKKERQINLPMNLKPCFQAS